MIMQMILLKFKVVEVPAVMHPRTAGASMHSGLKPIWYMLRMFFSVLAVVFRCKVLKVDENGNLTTKTTIPSHVVAFGNSLTNNWGYFGLAASNPNSDWFAHIKNYVTNVNPNATFNRFGSGINLS